MQPLSNINLPGGGAADLYLYDLLEFIRYHWLHQHQSVNYAIVELIQYRKLIVNFSSLAQFSCTTSVGLQTSQIVLLKLNIIEVYAQNRTPCNSHQSGRGTIGI
jgi:hypothetical protein